MELSCDESLKMEFNKLELSEFSIKIINEYDPSLSGKTLLLILISFTTTSFPCEIRFPLDACSKKPRFGYKLNLDSDLRLKSNTTEPDIS